MASLNDQTLRLSRNLEIRSLADGLVLMKQTVRRQYLALTPEQKSILDNFNGRQTIQEVLQSHLLLKGHLKIRAYYDLVINAMEKGFLLESDQEPTGPPLEGRQWKVRWGATSAIALGLSMMGAGAAAMVSAPIALVHRPWEWVQVVLFLALGLSLSYALAGCVLSGFGRLVYGARIRFDTWPHFSVDISDAFMGGRLCEVCVALQALAAPFVVALGAVVWDSAAALLAAWITILVVACPFGNTPAHQLLHALFRKDYQLPRCASQFLNSKMVTQMFQWKQSLVEEKYFLLYSTYAILWLGGGFRFASQLFEVHQREIIQEWLRPGGSGGFWGPLVGFVLLLALVAAPLIYLAWLLGLGLHRAAASRWFTAESGLTRYQASGQRPSGVELLKFLQNSLLFSQLAPAELRQVSEAMGFVSVKPGTGIIREHEVGESLFVVYAGSVEVLKETEAGEARRVAELGVGDVFGEIALLDQVPRSSSVRALKQTDLLSLSKADFDRLMVSTLGAGKIKTAVQVCSFLKRNPLFAEWHPQPLLKLSSEFAFRDFKNGDVVIRENQPNDSFYLVYEGEFEVRKQGSICASLRPGDFCGEISLLKDTPATADVVALQAGRCLQLAKASFLRLVSQDFLTGMVIETTAESRLSSA